MLTTRSIADKFEALLKNLRTQNDEKVRPRRKAITKRLNQDFWHSESETEHSRLVGSYGRGTEIRGTSDVDMLIKLPWSVYNQYNAYLHNGQSALLQAVRDSIRETYSDTDVGGNGQVVIRFSDGIEFEVLPAFSNDGGSYTYPDSKLEGSVGPGLCRPSGHYIQSLLESTGGSGNRRRDDLLKRRSGPLLAARAP